MHYALPILVRVSPTVASHPHSPLVRMPSAPNFFSSQNAVLLLLLTPCLLLPHSFLLPLLPPFHIASAHPRCCCYWVVNQLLWNGRPNVQTTRYYILLCCISTNFVSKLNLLTYINIQKHYPIGPLLPSHFWQSSLVNYILLTLQYRAKLVLSFLAMSTSCRN